MYCIRWFNEMGWNYISVDLSLFVLLYNTNFIHKLKFNDLKIINYLTLQIFENLQNNPTFHSEERLVTK